jgi:type IV pilus assembly protein PilW
MLVGTTVALLVLASLGFVLITQARSYQAHASRRFAQAGARQGLAFLERYLRRAGYGVDPERALLAYDGYDVTSGAQDLRYPDALTVYARSLEFRRKVVSATASQLTLEQPLSQPLLRGQVLLVLCAGARTYAYVTVGTAAPRGATSVSLALPPSHEETPVSAPGQRFYENGKLAERCFSLSPVAVRVERHSFYVAAFDEDGDAATPSTTPYLMLHQGLDVNGDGNIDVQDATPVAAGVEQLQVAWVLESEAGREPLLLGVEEREDRRPPWGEQWLRKEPPERRPRMEHPYGAGSRRTNHPANVRQVRVTLVARGPIADRQQQGDDVLTPHSPDFEGDPFGPDQLRPWRQLEDLQDPSHTPFNPRGGGHARTVLRLSVAPKNLLMRSQFMPPQGGGG